MDGKRLNFRVTKRLKNEMTAATIGASRLSANGAAPGERIQAQQRKTTGIIG
jgi:hypothetical protein